MALPRKNRPSTTRAKPGRNSRAKNTPPALKDLEAGNRSKQKPGSVSHQSIPDFENWVHRQNVSRCASQCSLVLKTLANEDYALIDSGNGLKLERYGTLTTIRPEGQAIWQPRLNRLEWQKADAIFTGDTEEDGMGRWAFPKGEPAEETWPLSFEGMSYLGRFTSFRHVGVFPEQAAHWLHMQQSIRQAKPRQIRVLNLFAYTGVASLVAAKAGAHVTHVDASKRAIQWAKENQTVAGLEEKPIRWICEDALKFCAREVRRGNTYDAILLDPPAYGRGPKGETWQLFANLKEMLELCRQLLSNDPLFVALTAYAIRSSHFALAELMQDCFGALGGKLESGELVLEDVAGERQISTSLFSRWQPDLETGGAK